ncbi:hypothetical protein [Planctomyces sp. SH-PL62]|uniref:hypothetical protein n=1 Tax=Planctomyces sp. SH-PL62 TaxID=1636152 RepID=UPI00078C50A4|nr:hypothetical protein [Planctomyces sp. SH-PL62]AMV40479.1 hypothetical protein VT85_23820 [Planctomyces sp. SH-PL62]
MALSSPVDLAEIGGDLELARMTARHVRAALAAGIDCFYAYPGGLVVETPGSPPLRAAAQRTWILWIAQLRRSLGAATKRRSLAAGATDLDKQLAWRGVMVRNGHPVAWTDWTPGEAARVHDAGIVPTLKMIEAAEDLSGVFGEVR